MAKKRPSSSEKHVSGQTKRHMKKKSTTLQFMCPFRANAQAHDPVFSCCDENKTFPSIDKLNEHLRRVHSPEYWCLCCKKKFNSVSKDDLAALRSAHERDGSCTEREWTGSQHEWAIYILMSQDQYARWQNRGSVELTRGVWQEDGVSRKEPKPSWTWRKIFTSLFPAGEIPDPRDGYDLGEMLELPELPELSGVPDFPDMPGDQFYFPGENEDPSHPGNTLGYHTQYEQNTFDTGRSELAFRSPYTGDLSGEQHQQRQTASGEATWEEDTGGPSSYVHSTTSGLTTVDAEPSTPRYVTQPTDVHNDYLQLESTCLGGYEVEQERYGTAYDFYHDPELASQ